MSEAKELTSGRWWRGNIPSLALIVLLGVLIYGHTLNVPWYLDDNSAIVENRAVHRMHEALADLFSGRGLANLTFALNYRWGGTDVTGYHVVNIAIHIITSCVVFLILKRVFRDRLLLALGGALVFLSHPLQTQAVTYIVQRMTSLAALLFFLGIYLYLLAREGDGGGIRGRRWLFYGAALLAGALAVLTKQNTAVLPVALLIFERYFLPAGKKLPWPALVKYLAPFCVVPFLVAARALLLPALSGSGIENVGGMPDLVHLQNNTPLNYLVTQFSVIWLYLRLLFIPYGQVLDYDIPIATSLWQLKNVAGSLGIALLLVAAGYLRKRQPLISAAILWFFLGLSVESTIIPLDPVFEHRLYIPMFGFAIFLMDALGRLPRRTTLAGIALATLALAVLTWQRNDLWNDPLAFYQDNLRRAPKSERVHLDLANAYQKMGDSASAEQLYLDSLRINPDYVLVYINLSRVYAARQQYQKAVDCLLEGLRRDPSHYKLYNNIGVLYNVLGQYQLAADYLRKGALMEPEDPTVHFNLGLALERLGAVEEAIASYRRSITLNPNDAMNYFNLGLALYSKKDLQGALQAFQNAARLNPTHSGSFFNAGMIYLEMGQLQEARNIALQLQNFDSTTAVQLHERIVQARR